MGLPPKLLEQFDAVDGAIHELLVNLVPKYTEWDIEKIGAIRDAISDAFHMTDDEQFDFYPWERRHHDRRQITG